MWLALVWSPLHSLLILALPASVIALVPFRSSVYHLWTLHLRPQQPQSQPQPQPHPYLTSHRPVQPPDEVMRCEMLSSSGSGGQPEDT